jgi:predicted RNA-binding protein with PUA domain
LRILGYYCHDLNLVASQTAYVKWGKDVRTPLRFTKTGEQRLERIYARHFVWPGKGPLHPPREWPDAGA